MKLYQIFNQIKWSIWVNWYLGQMWPESFIEVANTALMYVRTYLWRKRSRQLTTQKITNRDVDNSKIYYFKTMFPISSSDIKFFYSKEVEKIEEVDYNCCDCACIDHIDMWCCECSCSCDQSQRIEMNYVQPWTPLSQWDFTIIAWWIWWSKIKAYFPCVCTCWEWTVYITYYMWTRLFNCLNDWIPLPDEYIEVFKLILKWLMSTNIWNGQSNKETLWFSFAKEILDWLDYHENNIPWYLRWK